MGQLRPDTTYIYESPDNGRTIYAREFGSDKKFIIGLDLKSQGQLDLEDHKLWNDIRQAAKTNKALQIAMEHVKILYRLSKDDPL